MTACIIVDTTVHDLERYKEYVAAATVFVSCFLVASCQPAPTPQTSSSLYDDMQFVPGAGFRMGTDLAELDGIRIATGMQSNEPLMSEVPGHDVSVSDFYIDTFSVTNQNYAEFVKGVPAWRKERVDTSLHNGRYLEHWPDGSPPGAGLNHPVIFVTWHSAAAYCKWRDKRLPTEIEYEWAAQDDAVKTEYPWGNSPPGNDVVNWGGNDIESTVPVGSYPSNARGLYDMSGNVWHFTSDAWAGSYAEMAADPASLQRLTADPDVRRVVRGGSWGANAANLRIRYRDSHRPFDAREMVGFRCAKSAGASTLTS